VRRDIALLLDKTITAEQITSVIHQAVAQQDNAATDKAFQHCAVFDVYTGERIDAAKKSLALALYFQHGERSLNDEEVQQTVSYIVTALEAQLAAVLRN
jgi:phenylalanyl-tRNA synthetase beta chain